LSTYRYRAINQDGKTISEIIQANNEEEVSQRIVGQGLEILSIKSVREGRISGRVRPRDIILMCIQMEQLEKAGVPLLDSLVDIRDSADHPGIRNLMKEVHEAVRQGKLLSEAMGQYPRIFDEVFTGLVSAGERTGNLAEIFGHLASHLKWVDDMRAKIKSASYYPIFLLITIIIVITIMMAAVIPKLSSFLLSLGFTLPGYTLALIYLSEFFSKYWPIVVGFLPTIYTLAKLAYRYFPEFAYQGDRLKLVLPFIGNVIRKIEIARFCRFFAITYRSGIGILECLDIAGGVVHNRVLKTVIRTVRKDVSEGSTLTKSIGESKEFPPLVVRMIRVGEQSGNLDQTLESVNFFYDREVADAVNNVIGAVQPTLTVILGGMMFWVSVAVFGPIYGNFGNMQK
jgi:type IV pilus assembly protein PilC